VALRFADVASADSPGDRSSGIAFGGGRFADPEQNYQYDLLNPAKLLDKYVAAS